MILLVDVGNSNIVFGEYDGNQISRTYRLKSFTDKTSDEYYLLFKNIIDSNSYSDVIISSVVPVITSSLNKMFHTYFSLDPIILGPGVKTGVMVKADDPKSVGADMICDVAGALKYGEDSLIIDLGTATKYIYAHKNTFMGASIAPGVAISMKALVSGAALLPSIELQKPDKILCNNTISCMQSGIMFGAACQVDSMIDRIKEELNNPNLHIVATGGLAKVIVPLCKHSIEFNENLVLEGLIYIYHKNCQK